MPSDHSSLDAVRILAITDPSDPALAGFTETYQEVFAEEPYFEDYTPQAVLDDVWLPHSPHCILVATEDSGRVVGLACCHPALADTEPSIRDYLLAQELPFDPAKAIFMSELAVRREQRRNGLGKRLIFERFRWGLAHGFESFCMRTAAIGSHSERLYGRIGAKRAAFVQDVSDGKVMTASNQRIYLYGSLADALAAESSD